MTKHHVSKGQLFAISGVLLIIAVVLIICFLLRGQSTSTGDFPDPVVSKTLVCTSDSYKYPLYEDDGALSRNMKVTAIYSGDKFSSISLVYRLKYNNNKEVEDNEARFHAVMNISFGNDGMGPDALGASYTTVSSGLNINLADTSGKLDSLSAKYFLINSADSNYSYDSLKKNYTNKGFNCSN